MKTPIQVAVRIRPGVLPNNPICVQTYPYTNHVRLGNQHSIPVTYALPIDYSQSQIFTTTVLPLVNCVLEGCDISVIATGQTSAGKSYTLLGPGFHCAFSETEHGIIPRFVREIFSQISHHSERTCVVNLTWTQVCGDNIQDLFGAGSVQCCSVSETFHWLQLGMNNRAPRHAHTLFTLTLEQQWMSPDRVLQHRISTASFSDLTSSEKVYVLGHLGEPQLLPTDNGLLALDRVVTALTTMCPEYQQQCIPYNQSMLTTLLKDSFGGRAKTLIICCVSPYLEDFTETFYTLQLAIRVQNIQNFVTMNSFSNVEEFVENFTNEQESIDQSTNADMFGLQFAASQWLKLVSNAEDLFHKLISNNELTEAEKEQISEWLFLKQECEECLSTEETISIDVTEPRRSLGRIEEETETDRDTSTPTNCESESETETDLDYQQPDFLEKLDLHVQQFYAKTDRMFQESCEEFFGKDKTEEKQPLNQQETIENSTTHLQGARGRRRSIHPGQLLELDMPPNASQYTEKLCSERDDGKSSPEPEETEKIINTDKTDPAQKIKALLLSNEAKQVRIRQVTADLEGSQKQIEELQYTIQIKEQLIQDMIRNGETRSYAKQKFQKKRSKLEEEYYKARTRLAHSENALLQNGGSNKAEYKNEVEKYRTLSLYYEKRLKDVDCVKQIAEESVRKVLELENSLHTSRKQLERLKKQLYREEKRKHGLEQELITNKMKIAELEQQQGNFKEVDVRISHLDQVLKEKSINLEKTLDYDEKEALRHEIRNLRRTRDCLVEQRCHLDRKLQKEKMLSDTEERKLLECEEAIEAIDAAIEYKNELICGRKEMDSERIQREKGEEMLMQRLNKLSEDEMRTLLYKYFQKVIDLRDSGKKLEVQLLELERERETSAWRIQALSHALQQVRLEGEKRIVLLQRQHEDKLNLMLRHFADETSASSSCDQKIDKIVAKTLERSKRLDVNQELTAANGQLACYKHQDNRDDKVVKYREEGREKNKLIARFQELTRYHTEKRRIQEITIPQQNLRQLQPAVAEPATKVTRQKNKLIIQQSKPKKYSKN